MLNPETITVLDPACGSGHILVEAYEVLKAIYLERGYQLRSIPRLILEKNLYGLDIDDRAAQLAGFALLMKARADDRRLFDELPKLNVYSIQSSKNLNLPLLWRQLDLNGQSKIGVTSSLLDELQTDLVQVIDDSNYQLIKTTLAVFEQAQTLGSLIQVPAEHAGPLRDLLAQLQALTTEGNNFQKIAATTLIPFIRQAVILGMQFDAVVANPPYMGNKYLTPLLKSYLKENYKGFEKDLFSAFMIRNLSLTNESGQLGFMSPFVWMFISSYEELRKHFIDNATLTSLIQLEYSGFDGATVPICTFTLGKAHIAGFTGSYIRLSNFRGADQQAPKTLEAIQNPYCDWFYTAKPDNFKKIPSSPVAYWISDKNRERFSGELVKSIGKALTGLQTGNSELFLRRWWEISSSNLGNDIESKEQAFKSGLKWFKCSKGGEFRKWYGNKDYVVNWYSNGKDIKEKKEYDLDNGFITANNSKYWNQEYYFKEGIAWNLITSGSSAFRFYENGVVFDISSPTFFIEKEDFDIYGLLGFFNSKIIVSLVKALSPTINFSPGVLANLPAPKLLELQKVKYISKEAVIRSKLDWDSSENSWDFTENTLIHQKQNTLEQVFEQWQTQSRAAITEMQCLEEENNRLFIEAYGLQDELSPDVPEDQITLTRADREKDSQRLISYAIGCMMGRYRLDRPGGILHITQAESEEQNQEQIPPNPPFAKGGIFTPDADGIVPITDELWFEDDAANRLNEFLLAAFSGVRDEGLGDSKALPTPHPSHLAPNMQWLATSLGQKGNETPQETIRRYIAGSFYKTHLQTYKKRPIYWLFSSGKQGAFQALVYLHRYNESTLSRMRAEYVVPLTGKIQSRIDMLAEVKAVTGGKDE